MLTVAQTQYSLPQAMLPQRQTTRLDAGAAPFQPSAAPPPAALVAAPLSSLQQSQQQQDAHGPSRHGKRRGGRSHSHREQQQQEDSLALVVPADQQSMCGDDAAGGDAPNLVQRERWARSRIARMELTEAARIEMQLQNLNIKRSASANVQLRGPNEQPRRGSNDAPRTCDRSEDADGVPIYEFGNGMPGGVCVYFMKGYCGLGNRCRYVHDPTDPGHIVKITGMPYVATAREVHEFFRPLEIEEGGVSFLLSAEGRPTGSAFVEFRDRHAALVAVGKDRAFFTSNRFVLIFASSKKEREWYLRHPQPFSQSRAGAPRGARDAAHDAAQICPPAPTPPPARIIRVIRHCAPPTPLRDAATPDYASIPPQQVPPQLLPHVPPSPAPGVEHEIMHQQRVIREQAQQLQQQQLLLQAQKLFAPPSPLYTPQTHAQAPTPYASAAGATPSHGGAPAPLPAASPLTPDAGEGQLLAAAGVPHHPQQHAPAQQRVHPMDVMSAVGQLPAPERSPARALLPTFDDSAESSFDADSPQTQRPPAARPAGPPPGDASGAMLLEHLGAQLQGRALASLTGMDGAEVASFLGGLGYMSGQQQAICSELDHIRGKARAVHAAAQKLFPAQAAAETAGFDDMPPLVPGEVEGEAAVVEMS